MSITRKTADLSNRRSTNECRTIGIDRQVNKKQKQKCKVSHVISCPITRELVHFCSVIHQHHTLCHWSSRRDLRNETTAEVRNATHFFLLIRKHESSSRPKHCPCYYSSSWAICMGHSSAKLLWEQIQGHVRLEHTQDSPIFPCFHSLNILSLLFFFKAQNEDFMSFSGRVMFYLRCPASTMNFTWQKLHPTTSLNLCLLVSRAVILQPTDVLSPTGAPAMGLSHAAD